MTDLSYSREFNLDNFKRKMIDILKERPLEERELDKIMIKAFPEEKINTTRVRVDRFRKDLTTFGLIYDNGEKYVWRSRTKNNINMLAHSRQLIPALKNLGGIIESIYATSSEPAYISTENMRFLVSCAEDHLRTYEGLWNLIQDHRRKNSEIERSIEEFCISLKKKLSKKISGVPIDNPGEKRRHRIFLGTNIPLLILGSLRYDTPLEFKLEGDEIWLGGNLIASGTHLLEGISEFVSHEIKEPFNIEAVKLIEESQNSANEVRDRIEHEIRKIIFRIDSGTSLRGGCEICAETDNVI